jgi:S1-C subfamily serine protease
LAVGFEATVTSKPVAVLLLVLASVLMANGQVTVNVISRVMELRVPGGTGTSFFIEYEGQEYLITANHVVAGLGELARVELLADRVWHAMNVRVLHGESRCDDVAVLVPQQKERVLPNVDPLPWTSLFTLGEEAYFLGFPYGLVPQTDNLHMTIPIIKHGYVSAVIPCSELDPALPTDQNFVLLDGFNNPGFSGGPVVSREQSDPQHTFKVFAVIAGYRAEKTPLSVGGQQVVSASVETNTGIIFAVPFGRAIELIRESKRREKAKP